MLTLQAKKIEGALQELVAVNGVAVDLMRKAREELGANCEGKYALSPVDFRGMVSGEGFAAWRNFVKRELMHEGQAYVEPPRVEPKPVVIPADDGSGQLRVLFLSREGRYQPGDQISLPYRDAERLVRAGRAEPAQKAVDIGELKSVGSVA
jgi:hypothetical protein